MVERYFALCAGCENIKEESNKRSDGFSFSETIRGSERLRTRVTLCTPCIKNKPFMKGMMYGEA